MPDKLLELKNDLVFQKIFGMQKNSLMTGHFLSLILGKEIYNVDLDVNKRMLNGRADAKTGRLDIRVKFNDGEDCNIELQVVPYQYMPERLLEYWAKMYDTKISSGQKYNVLKPTIAILIADYRLEQLRDIPKYQTVWNLREKDFHNKILTKDIEIHVLEIPKIKEKEILNDQLAQWLKFIENPEDKEVAKFMSENKYLKQAKEELAYLSGDPDFQLLVESREGMLRDIDNYKDQCREEGLAEGRAEGRAKGRAEGLAEGLAEGQTKGERKSKKQIAKKMKEKNIPIEEIIELTELKKEEIEEL